MKEQFIRIDKNGHTFYYSDKAMTIAHREDGPSVIYLNAGYSGGSKMWHRNGMLHRDDGPAVEFGDGRRSWYISGYRLTEEEFNNAPEVCSKSYDGKIVEVDGKKYKLTLS
jgi:hypothetical protein